MKTFYLLSDFVNFVSKNWKGKSMIYSTSFQSRGRSRSVEDGLLVVGCRFESNCPLVGPGTIDGMPSVGVFLRDPSPYLREFRKNHGKLRTARSTIVIKSWTWYLPSTRFEHRNTPLLVWQILRRKQYINLLSSLAFEIHIIKGEIWSGTRDLDGLYFSGPKKK